MPLGIPITKYREGEVMKLMQNLIVLLIVVFLTACGSSDVKVTAKFDNTKDIEEGASVYFEGKSIGEISDVVTRESGSIVELSLEKSVAKKLAAKSAVVVNRLKTGAPIEIYNRVGISKNKLESGQEIEGLDSMFQLGAWMIGDVVQTGAGSLSKYVGAFQKYLGSNEFEQGKLQVQEQLTGLTESASQAVKSMEKEFNTAINELSINEEQVAQTIEQLGDELSPIVSEVARSSTELVGQLEQFIVNIEENTNFDEQQTGERFLQSLIGTFEKLNQSIEEGAEKGLNTQEPTPSN